MRLLLVLSVFTFLGFSSPKEHGCNSYTPENNISVAENALLTSGVTEAEVQKVADELYDLYAPAFTALKRSLVFDIQWSEDKFNAYTNLWRGRANIVMTGGMIRFPDVTLDGLTLVLCHEIGHHLAGKPKHQRGFGFATFASAEGQSDYFATLKCMRKFLLQKSDNTIDTSLLPLSVVQACEDAFQSENMQNICMRSMLASETMAKVLNKIRDNKVPHLHFDSPDPTIVKKVFLKHPNPQCRLDTYYAGGLCQVDHNEDIDIQKDGVAQCTRNKGHQSGLRPLCWYKN